MFALFGAFYVVPPQGSDRFQHVSAIIEARDAWREGQVPPRVAPRMGQGRRYPLFQFYGQLPYSAAGALALLPGVDAYDAWRVVTFLCVTCAGFYAYRCGLLLTRQTWAAIVTGVVFVAAPYLATDVRARFAYTEAVSFCLLPAVLYYSLRAFVSPRDRSAPVLGGVAWAGVALSHNITYLYASPLLALFFLSMAGGGPRKFAARMSRVGVCYLVGLLLALWYVVPQLQVLRYIGIAVMNQGATPMGSTTWAPLYALLSPVLTISPTARNTPYLGVQVGWPILAGVVLALFHVARAIESRRRGGGLRTPGPAVMVRLLVAFALAFFIVWSPVDFWRYVPSLFYNLQITYRVLMFVVLWGSLLTGMSLARFWRHRPGGTPPGVAWACVLVVAVMAIPFQGWSLERMSSRTVKLLETRPIFGAADDVYATMPERMPQHRVEVPTGAALVRATDLIGRTHPGRTTRIIVPDGGPRVAQVPVIFYPRLQDVRVDGRRAATVGHVDGLLALGLPAGPHEVAVRFVGTRWANWASAAAWLPVLVAGGAATVRALRRPRPPSRDRHRVDSRPAAFPARAAAFGAVLMVLPMSLPAAFVHWRKNAAERAMGLALPSGEAYLGARVTNAFDGDPETEWVTVPGPSAWLVLMPPQPRTVSAVELEPRQTEVLGGWHKVRVVLYRGERTVADQAFDLPDAARQPLQVLTLARPAEADGIELRFSEPVTLTRAGDRRIPPEFCYCGYREIRIR
jgi:hypothetical protein